MILDLYLTLLLETIFQFFFLAEVHYEVQILDKIMCVFLNLKLTLEFINLSYFEVPSILSGIMYMLSFTFLIVYGHKLVVMASGHLTFAWIKDFLA